MLSSLATVTRTGIGSVAVQPSAASLPPAQTFPQGEGVCGRGLKRDSRTRTRVQPITRLA